MRLAEFKELRAEIVSRVNAQFLFVTANATLSAAVGALVVRREGDYERGLLLLLPFLSATLQFIYVDHGLIIMLLGSYIRTQLAPRMPDPTLLGWEGYLYNERSRQKAALTTTVALASFVAFSTPAVLALTSLVLERPPTPTGLVFWVLWGLGLTLITASNAALLLLATQQVQLDKEYYRGLPPEERRGKGLATLFTPGEDAVHEAIGERPADGSTGRPRRLPLVVTAAFIAVRVFLRATERVQPAVRNE